MHVNAQDGQDDLKQAAEALVRAGAPISGQR